MSLWTPLHQAVYSHVDDEASSILIERLLRAGAFRKYYSRLQSTMPFSSLTWWVAGTLRSQWTPGFSYPNMTALEMAQDLGYQTLYSILSPVIHQPVPADILAVLQDKFHDLIRKDLGDRVEQEYINLPVLEVLTELELPQMWFPVKFHKFSPAVSSLTISYGRKSLMCRRAMCIALIAANSLLKLIILKRLILRKRIA